MPNDISPARIIAEAATARIEGLQEQLRRCRQEQEASLVALPSEPDDPGSRALAEPKRRALGQVHAALDRLADGTRRR